MSLSVRGAGKRKACADPYPVNTASVVQKRTRRSVNSSQAISTAQVVAKRTRRSVKTLSSAFEATRDQDNVSSEVQDEESNLSNFSMESDEEEYEVEEVLDENEEEASVLVSWVGYDEQTWEPTNQIPKLLLNRYRKKARKKMQEDKSKINQDLVNISKPIMYDNTKPTTCVICDGEDKGGRFCALCTKPVHHMCSNELFHKLGFEEVVDICYCSSLCYEQSIGVKSKSFVSSVVGIENPTPTKQKIMSAKKIKRATEMTRPVDDLVGKSIAFAPKHEENWLPPDKYEGVGSTLLVGVVTRKKKNARGKAGTFLYEVKWTNSQFQSASHIHFISQEKVEEGIRKYEAIMKSRIPDESWDVLCKPFDEVTPTSDLWDEFEEVQDSYVRFETKTTCPVDLAEVEAMKSMEFSPDVSLAAPPDLYRHEDGGHETRLKDASKLLFEHSASSAFFALLPLSFWRTVVDNTNLYARNQKQPLVTLDELMKFLGILFYITMVDKGEHANYWGDQIENMMFGEVSSGLERVMSFKRFKYIRKNLCFRDSVTLKDLQIDPAARVRPLINMLKLRSPSHIVLGRNVAVDETSIACRSKYGRHMILYNKTKPTGKYHFRIYMMCCSETWYGVNMKLHCSSEISERLSGVEEQSTIQSLEQAMVKSKDVRKHVLEVTLPIHKTQRIVNTDNYYTSVQLLESLRHVGLYGRGTIRENSKFGHKCFMLNKLDKLKRGTTRQGVALKQRILGASWVDSANVNILSNADDSTISSVTRMIAKTKVEFQAPTCIKEYNQAMQGVDRIDQLRSRFSIADGHTFKKWHKKLAMAYIDIARCNAFICRKLAGATTNQRDPHRQFMIELSSQLVHGEWENALGDNGMLYSAPANSRSSLTAASPRVASPARFSVECSFENSKQVFPNSRPKRGCAVCRFEGRHPSEQTVYCVNHRVSLCTSVHTSPTQPFMCQDTSLTCWAKFHGFYLVAGLFNKNGNIRSSCHLFQAKKEFDLRPVLPSITEEPSSTEDIQTSPDLTIVRSRVYRQLLESADDDIPPFHYDSSGTISSVNTIGEYQTASDMEDHNLSFDFQV